MEAKKDGAGAQYDGDLQMFRVAAHEPSKEALRFLRWMAEQGRLEHEVAGASAGEYALEVGAAFRARNVVAESGGRGVDAQHAEPMVNAQVAYRPRVPRIVGAQPFRPQL